MSISVYAGKFVDEKTIDWVFTREETTAVFYKDFLDPDDEGIPNPAYRPEFDINMTNHNARVVFEKLGVHVDDGGFFQVPVDEMINRCTAYLRRHFGKKSPGEKPYVLEGPGATFIHCGTDDGYIEKQVHRIAVLAREGKARGAEVIYGA